MYTGTLIHDLLSAVAASCGSTPASTPSRIAASRTVRAMGPGVSWSAVIGIIPVIGDILDMLIALSIIRTCMEVELPKHIVTTHGIENEFIDIL